MNIPGKISAWDDKYPFLVSLKPTGIGTHHFLN
jgi:hypothetical protein